MGLSMACRAGVGAAVLVFSITAAGAQTWVRAHGIGGYNRAFDVQPTADGGFIVVGDTEAGSLIYRQNSVVKLYPSGNVEWRRDFGTDTWDVPRAVRQTPDGGYLVVGETGYLQGHFTRGIRDFWVVRLDAGGNIDWQRAYGGADHDYAQDLVTTPDGGVLVVGHTLSFGAGCADVWALRLDPAGDVLWERAYGGSDCDRAYAIAEAHGGGYVLTGHVSDTAAASKDLLVMKIDEQGGLDWSRLYGPTGSAENDWGYSITPTGDGGYVVGATTSSFGGVGDDWLLLELDGAGDVASALQMDGSRNASSPGDKLGAARPTADGGVVLAGGRPNTSLARDQDLWVQKLDAQGNYVWGRLYRGAGDDFAHDVHVLPDGGLIVAGETESYDVGSFWTLRLDGDGLAASDCAPAANTFVLPTAVTVPVADVALTVTVTSATVESLELTEGFGAVGQATQCIGAPTEVSPPGAAQPLAWSDATTLVWQDAVASNADTFNLYRGTVGDLALGDFGGCLASGLASPTAQDGALPLPAEAWTYLVTGANTTGEGVLGYGSSTDPRPNDAPCP